MSTIIRGNVIRIPDEYSVILSVGQRRGVKEGMTFAIYAEGENIRDPISQKNLGYYELVKARVIIVHVQDEFSVARNAETETVSATSSAIRALRNEFTVVKKLPVDEQQIKPIAGSSDLKIKVGDKAREISQ
jgi:hypothetical protein